MRSASSSPRSSEGAAHFDGPGGSQTPQVVADAVATTMTSALANRGQLTAAERRADGIVLDARTGDGRPARVPSPSGIVFGRSMTQLTYDFARTLAKYWGPGDEVIVSRLDHDANIRPWVQAAEAVGATVRWLGLRSARPPSSTTSRRCSPTRTRLVAVTGASNLLGTRPDTEAIAAQVHEAGALLYVDGVHLTAHAPVDTSYADFFVCSPYKFFGPHLGVLTARPDAARNAAAGQAAASARRRTGAVRVRHAAVRAAGRYDGRRRLHRRDLGGEGATRRERLN